MIAPSAYFDRLLDVFSAQEARLNKLDAAIGDGDHGTTIKRGLTAAAAADDGKKAKAFMRASGGASGTLFGLLLIEIERHLAGDGQALERHLARALERISDLGQARQGDKSMIDALAPAVETLKTGGDAKAALQAAEKGRDATVPMHAKRGRARYVENGGEGHMDPGAASVCLMFAALLGE